MTLGGCIAFVAIIAVWWCSELEVREKKARKRRWHR
jgi:hypothetical protein